MSKFHTVFRTIICKSIQNFRLHLARGPILYTNRLSKYKRGHLLVPVALLSGLIRSSSKPEIKGHFDVENEISQSIRQAEQYVLDGKLKEAKQILNTALQMADDNQAYGSLSFICDLFTSIVLNEGDLHEAENVLVKFTEKLLQLGYPETHNSIVSFKLKLARLYQLLGSQEMAEYGFRDCIRVQEKKLEVQKELDEDSNSIYFTALFWFGKLLADQQDFKRARKQYKMCWERILKSPNAHPSQKMVVLHSIASVSASLKDFDEALHYLYNAIEVCLSEDPSNSDLPIYIVQVGLVLLQKGVYEDASIWCQTGQSLAIHEGHQLAETEGETCIKEIQKMINTKNKAKS